VTIVSAVSARAAYPGATGLAAVNGALEAMVPALAVELAPLRVNAVSPGVIDTQWWDGLPDGQRAGFFAAMAAAIVYLAGAGFVTGTVLECTGGANLTVGAVAG
jgi:NAD(P)-dependent dehydrogenase (short-subunit alcohol dehydrogenase family)